MSTASAFDPYAYAASQGNSAPPPFDPYSYAASSGTQPSASSKTPAATAPPSPADQELAGEEQFADWFREAAERAIVSPIRGAAGLLARVTGHDPAAAHAAVDQALTEDPTPGAQAFSQRVGRAVAASPVLADIAGAPAAGSRWIGEHFGATAQDIARQTGGTLGDVAQVLPVAGLGARAISWGAAAAPEDVLNGAQRVLDEAALSSPRSTGAAAAAPRLAQTSPVLQQAIVNAARQSGGAVNADALARHVEADTLPVPVQLTEGQALQDPVRISTEQNNRGQASGALAQRFNEQNQHLTQNFQAIRDEVGPDVYSANAAQHADTLIKAYQDKGAAADADIDAKYQALRDANGGKFPVNVKQLLTNTEQALHDKLLYEHAPTELGQLQSLAKSGNMTFEQFEAMRTNLARTMRSSTDGNVRAAAGVIRQQMEDLPLSGNAATLKPLADAARAAAKAQFEAVDADPAYKGALSYDRESPGSSRLPDQFIQKYVLGASRDQLALMRQNLAGDPVAQQTIGVATVDHLRHAAGIDDLGNGNVRQANFNKQLQALSPKIDMLVPPKTAGTLEQLGNVARYTQMQPRGAFVNNSNTLTGALAEHGRGLLEGAINAKTGGIGGTVLNGVLKRRGVNQMVRRALAPGAGLDVLPTQ